jgi:hypothetical protein
MSRSNNKKRNGGRKMAVLTAKCGRAFAVSAEQSKKFLEQKTNTKSQIKKDETLSKISAKIKNNSNDKS